MEQLISCQLFAEYLVETALSEASDQPGEVDLVAEDCYLHPKVRSTDERLNRKMEQLNSYQIFAEYLSAFRGIAVRFLLTFCEL